MSSIPCNVAILPSDDLADKAITASQQLRDLGSLFTLEYGRFYPHASIYMLQLKIDDLPQAETLLAEIATKTNDLDLVATNYGQSKNFLDVEYQKTDQISNLQQAVISALNPIRDGMREKDKGRLLEATGLALENYQKYGWDSVGELYRPHLTITRFAEPQPSAEALLPDVSSFSGQYTRLGLFEMGDNGTCIRKIAEYEFTR